MKRAALVSTLLFGFAAASLSLPAHAAPIGISDFRAPASQAVPSNPLRHTIQSRSDDNRDNLASDGFRNNFRNPQFRSRGNNFSRFRDQRFGNRGFNQNRFLRRGFSRSRFQNRGFGQNRFSGQQFRRNGFGGHPSLAKKKLGLVKKFLFLGY